ncbi:uncharacterized protein PHALS_01759 [Plasmopara halstedii]|uniref:Uncharacterized protein n=1 Tax=Plasmopara halstedii TaxID=4781 RepID=A0A0N7L6X2_PLAHL|nr:uncharacterized protein PHALS_01759 [Plasmopara halstedii]CEG45467.1 hypothetical protein PHALS_01759 [Plasmopara halstedii]|eukprot:XP_024581836.1 hypothetical protein PHALS_01759 [Plasmopara halstedii]
MLHRDALPLCRKREVQAKQSEHSTGLNGSQGCAVGPVAEQRACTEPGFVAELKSV